MSVAIARQGTNRDCSIYRPRPKVWETSDTPLLVDLQIVSASGTRSVRRTPRQPEEHSSSPVDPVRITCQSCFRRQVDNLSRPLV
jgi:hypothetical protein